MSVDQITNHFDQAIARLLTQYAEAQNIQNLISVYTTQIQELENIIYDMFLNRMIDTAVGQQLDNLGEIVGQPRLGFDDETYRVLLKFRIGVNVSQGTIEEVIQLFTLISGASEVHVIDEGGGSISIQYNEPLPAELEEFIFDNMDQVVAAGVRIDTFVEYSDDSFELGGL